MPSANVWGAMGAFLQSAGASAPKIAADYADEWYRRDDRKDRKQKLEQDNEDRLRRLKREDDALKAKASGGKKISSAMAAILSPMEVEEAEKHLANTPPEEIKKAEKLIEETGAAVAPKALPRQAQRWEANKVKNAMRSAIAEQESTSTEDMKEHPRAKNGLQAYGKYGIVPELHIDKVGLNPKDPKDIEKWKADKDLQEATFDKIIDANFKASGGDVDKALELYYGKAKDKNAKQRLADGREMPSVNEYIAQVKGRMGDAARGSVSGTAGNARQAIDRLVSQEFRPPSKDRMKRQEAAVGRLYADLTPEEIEQNKDYLDRVVRLAESGREEYKDELTQYGADLNRQTTAAINAMKLDEQMQMALLKLNNGDNNLTPNQVRALESRRKQLQSMREQITDFTTRVGSAKPGARENILKTRPDLTGKEEEPGIVGRLFGRTAKTYIDEKKIQKKLELIDEWIMETDRALAGLGGLTAPSAAEAEKEKSDFLSRSAGVGDLTPYMRPIKK